MEGQGKIGVELSGHGSKMVEEFDYGLLEHAIQAPFGGDLWEDWLKDRATPEARHAAEEQHLSPHKDESAWIGWVKKNVDATTVNLLSQLFRATRGGKSVP